MISNAFEHGSGGVIVELREGDGSLQVAVLDRGSADPSSKGSRRSVQARIDGRARHGHGLKVVRRVAARHGGGFQLRRSPQGTEARLALPASGGTR